MFIEYVRPAQSGDLICNSLWKQIRKVAYGTDSKSNENVCVKQFCESNGGLPNQRVGGRPTFLMKQNFRLEVNHGQQITHLKSIHRCGY